MTQNFQKYTQIDDFLSDIYELKFVDMLSNNEKFIINDPRLCDFNKFYKIYKFLLEYVDHTQIKIITFENNPEQCMINAKNIGRTGRNINSFVEGYTKMLDCLIKFKIKNYKLSVYKSI